MKVWIVTVGEPLPTDAGRERLHRSGTLTNFLSQANHSVLWWTSTFNHIKKEHRFAEDTEAKVNDHLTIRYLHGSGYGHNVSAARLVDHWILALKFARQCEAYPPPDIIVTSLPTLELSLMVCHYGRAHDIPVIVDVRDLWPDVFEEVCPRSLRPAVHAALWPFRATARRTCQSAAAIIGPTREYVEWGLEMAGRQATDLDRSFPFGYSAAVPSTHEVERANRRWAEQGLLPVNGRKIVCFFGTIGRQFDLDTVLDAAKILQDAGSSIHFVLCGNGDRLGTYRSHAAGLSNVTLPGWVDAPEIHTLMQHSVAGLAPYRTSKNFLLNLTNKPIEYLSAGLPVITGLGGVLARLLEENQCGLLYTQNAPESLAQKLLILDKDEAYLKRMRENADQLFKRAFDADRVYGALVQYLEEIVHRHDTSCPDLPEVPQTS